MSTLLALSAFLVALCFVLRAAWHAWLAAGPRAPHAERLEQACAAISVHRKPNEPLSALVSRAYSASLLMRQGDPSAEDAAALDELQDALDAWWRTARGRVR